MKIEYKRNWTGKLVLWTLLDESGKILTNGSESNKRKAKKAAEHMLRMHQTKNRGT